MEEVCHEYRVRAVKRYVVTHFEDTPTSCGSKQYGEFPNIEQAETVALALQAANPGSRFATIGEKREPLLTLTAYTREEADRLWALASPMYDTTAGAPTEPPLSA